MGILDYIALLMILVMIGLIAFLLWFLGGLPGRIAKARNHPYQQAISVGGWVTLFLAGVAWPFVLIWAYAPSGGEELGLSSGANDEKLLKEIESLLAQVDHLTAKLETQGGKEQ